MYQGILWFDIITFALMFASFGLAYISFSRTRLAWLRSYLVYQACYGLWLLFTTYYFFQAVYLPHPLPGLTTAAGLIRGAVSLVILYAGPVFALRISEIRIGRRMWWLLTLPVAFVFGGVLVYYATGSARVVLVPNGVFNLYLAVLFFLAGFKSAQSEPGSLRAAFRPFLWFTAAAYFVLLLANIFAVAIPAVARLRFLSVSLAGLFCFSWSVITIMTFLERMGIFGTSETQAAPVVEISADFVESFGVTQREREISEDLVSGLKSREIADKRFISPRTVDSHIYNLYRKCDVKNRVELIRLLERFRSGGV